MCELLAMSFNQPVRPNLSLRAFEKRGQSNPDGWGIAYYPDRAVQIIKEARQASCSPLSKFLKDYENIQSKIFIAHVRIASVSGIAHMNTHPFSRELNGKDYTFAHNGTLQNYEKLRLGRFRTIGLTDSEHVFCHILSCIEEKHITQWGDTEFSWIRKTFKKINKFGRFNCILSDGEHLFCYFDQTAYNGLCYVKREAPFPTVRLADEDFLINLEEEKDPAQKGFIIATRRLTNEHWESFAPGELIVFKYGEMIYSSSGRVLEQLTRPISQDELKILRTLRSHPSKMSLLQISTGVDLPLEKLRPMIRSLMDKGFIKQDRRDKVNWDDEGANYFTNPSKRAEIDKMIG